MVGEGKGKSGDAYVGTAAERSAHRMIASQICIMWSPTPPHGKVVKINIFTVLKCSHIGQKELGKSRHPVKNPPETVASFEM